ncbi:acetyltransferase [Wohlfahrtiimonas chitiniclastica]|uniref:acetyltransferase n=1 Tax=Wohlfahrtiimonas chitiniclastica TaxID=400946 RepID=UPI001BCFA38A|nr:acetyltransferase [Wohlfahrtiimonas chitiniclastica]MBS7834580.1 acetyltransferase [Wohlfahrtiimonas chitiniclastica]
MKKLAIVGAGGHGKVAAEIAELNGYQCIHFFDKKHTTNYPWPILGSLNDLIQNHQLYDEVFIAIGDNHHRYNNYIALKQVPHLVMTTLIHPSAIVSRYSDIAPGCLIAAGSIIAPFVSIEHGCIVNTGAMIDHDCTIQEFSHIAPGVTLSGGVTIGKNNWIGTGSTIIQNIELTNNIYIGAGSLIVKNLQKEGLYYGSPVMLKKSKDSTC